MIGGNGNKNILKSLRIKIGPNMSILTINECVKCSNTRNKDTNIRSHK